MTKTCKITSFFFVATALMLCANILQPNNTSALSGSDFNPGRIVDDAIFYNSQSMSAGQIQQFLESKVPNCDYNGTQPASDWGYPNLTHAQIAEYKRNGTNGFSKDTGFHAPPYKCLTMYSQSNPQMEAASGYCSAINAGTRTAAQIINDVAKACGINPQVLIILLEKEQSLVTDNWPLNRQHRSATGFACPDTALCDPAYEGFFYQVYSAARQFKVYQAYPNSYNYIAGRTNRIYWQTNYGNFVNPSGNADDPSRSGQTTCGYSNVYIENQATAALYIYTPYRPNQKSLANLRGTGDDCSTYGNRNFWRIFNDWFGSTYGITEQENAIYRLWNKSSNTHFMTADIAEAHRYLSAGWEYDQVAAYSSPSGVSVYRLYNKNTRSHFFTTSSTEVSNYTKAGWLNDGVVFKVPSSGKAVYRLYNKNTGGHIYTSSLLEVENYTKAGWHYDGLAYHSNYPVDQNAVYRLYNQFTRTHVFISSQAELGAYTAAGWRSDGVVFYTEDSDTPVYRLYNKNTRSHFFTTSSTEVSNYTKAGWLNDGVVFKVPSSGKAVYRLYNKNTGGHFFTTSSTEVSNYTKAGWLNDGIVFYSSVSISISRVYDQASMVHRLMKSSSVTQRKNLVNDGVIIKGLREGGTPVYELHNKSTGSFLYTANNNELSSYITAGWVNNGIFFYAPLSGKPIYRMYSPNTNKHVIVNSQAEVNNYTAAGWTSDGVVFYSD